MDIETTEALSLVAPGCEGWRQPYTGLRYSRMSAWKRLRHAVGLRLWDALHPTALGRALHRRLAEARHLPSVAVSMPRLPSGLSGLRVAFVSDLHAGCFTHAEDFVDWAERLRARAPDIICFGGDLIDVREEQVELLGPGLSLLARDHSLFAVPGNHDYYPFGRIERWRGYLERHGVTVLLNRGVRLEAGGDSLWLAGIDDLTEGEPDLDAALRGRDSEETTLLLSHHPDVFPMARRSGVDLQLSGHTHAGQVRLMGWAPVTHTMHGYVHGLYGDGDAQLFVGSGAGTTVMPLRVGTRPEVAILRLAG